MLNYENVLKSFKKYLENFDVKDENIAVKVNHSYHVADLAMKLGKRMELLEEELTLAKILGLLHDIGRFEQYKRAKVYDDIASNLDHALLGTEYLFRENHSKDFGLPEKYHSIIQKAIFNHNKLKIEDCLNEKELFFAKFLRDIDKIDIFRQQATSRIGPDCFNAKLSKKVKEQFFKHTLVEEIEIKNDSDIIATEIAFVFDISFKESYELLFDTDNLELYLSVIEVEKGFEDDFEEIKKEVRNFLEERMEH